MRNALTEICEAALMAFRDPDTYQEGLAIAGFLFTALVICAIMASCPI